MDDAGAGPRTPFEEAVVELADSEDVGHGDHWEIFSDDVEGMVTELIPTVAREGDPAEAYVDAAEARPLPFPETEPRGLLLAWPGQELGLLAVVELDSPKGGNRLVSAYPWARDGVEHAVTLESVQLWPNRLEARLDGYVGGELPVTFFDTLFAANRAFYEKGRTYRFSLAGFPLALEVAKPGSVTPLLAEEMDRIRLLRRVLQPGCLDLPGDDEPAADDRMGAVALFSREEVPDWYEFQGPVKAVAELPETFGQRLWRLRVAVSRLEEGDLDIDLFVTGKVLGQGHEPVTGDEVRGLLWLQGHLLAPILVQ